MDKIVREKVKQCRIYTVLKTSQHKFEGKLLDAYSIDILRQTPSQKKMCKQILIVIVNGFSRF